MSGKTFYTKMVFRGLWTDHSNGAEHIGFPVDGVYRGGYYTLSYGYANRARCGFRLDRARDFVYNAIGFP